MAHQYSPPNSLDADFNFEDLPYRKPDSLDADFNFALVIYYVLAGTSNAFSAIWADPDAGLTNGKMYTLSSGEGAALSILDLSTKTLKIKYLHETPAAGREVLESNDTVDLNVSSS